MRMCNKCNAYNVDGDKFCRSCGNSLAEENKLICRKCGSNNDTKSRFCSSCGYSLLPQSSAPQKQKVTVKQKTKKSVETIIAETVVGIILLVAMIWGGFFFYSKYRVYAYKNNLIEATNLMIDSSKDAEDLSIEFYSIWYNCQNEIDDDSTNEYTKNSNGIFYSDFNDAISNYTNTQKYQNTMSNISQTRSKVKSLYNDLTNPPEDCKDAYSHLIVTYDAYEDYMDVVMCPSGTINEYYLNYSTSVKFLSKYIKELQRYE